MLVANLAGSVNYDRKVHCKLEHVPYDRNYVPYDRKTFILQASGKKIQAAERYYVHNVILTIKVNNQISMLNSVSFYYSF
jgi:hypothetical protein